MLYMYTCSCLDICVAVVRSEKCCKGRVNVCIHVCMCVLMSSLRSVARCADVLNLCCCLEG